MIMVCEYYIPIGALKEKKKKEKKKDNQYKLHKAMALPLT